MTHLFELLILGTTTLSVVKYGHRVPNMTPFDSPSNELRLSDGSRIGVIGGGPTGSFFSIFVLKMAKMLGLDVGVTIFEPKDFKKDGPAGCNKCGGIISELLVQMLAVEGITLDDRVVREGIVAYRLHTEEGEVTIAAPGLERRIASVYRGGGPKGMLTGDYDSFDHYLLQQAIAEGAEHSSLKIDRVELRGDRPVLFAQDKEMMTADLLVGAYGLSSTAKLFEGLGFGYREPPAITTAIAELKMTEETVHAFFGHAINLFLLPDKGLKFAAMIPKGSYVTLCILGTSVDADTVSKFLSKPIVKRFLPDSAPYTIECRCLPKMNVGAPATPCADRIVVCGDCGSTRLFKDGLGAAYLMGKAAAKTAVFHGIGRQHFENSYRPTYDSIIQDNMFGRILFTVTDVIRKNRVLTRGMLETVRKEQRDCDARILSTVLWEMFTGNERYKNIFPKTLNPRMNLSLVTNSLKALVRPAQ